MRILVGTVEVAGICRDLSCGLRRLGHRVTTAVCERNSYYPDYAYDVELTDIDTDAAGVEGAAGKTGWWKSGRSCTSLAACAFFARVNRLAERLSPSINSPLLRRLVHGHDLFIFVWGGTSLTRGNVEFPLLKRLGKQIVCIFMGSDVRHTASFKLRHSDLEIGDALEDKEHSLSTRLRNTRMAELYADAILSQPNQSVLAVRPYFHLFLPLDLGQYSFQTPQREVPVVVHAPSSRAVKGTERILAALQTLEQDGVRFELRLLEGLPNEQVLSSLASADVVVDQLHLPLHGKLGLEAMASGCALATCNREDYEPTPPERPIWHIQASNVAEQLRHLLTDRPLRVRLAREARAYVERYHDRVQVANLVLQNFSRSRVGPFDHYPTHYTCLFRPNGEQVKPKFQRMTTKIIRRWGLPEGVDAADLVDRGLASERLLMHPERIPRWPRGC